MAGLNFFCIPMKSNQEPFLAIPNERIAAALRILLDERLHPILVHCERGQNRTGCIIGCLRRVRGWSLGAIFNEYQQFNRGRLELLDQQVIEMFPLEIIAEQEEEHGVNGGKSGGDLRLPR